MNFLPGCVFCVLRDDPDLSSELWNQPLYEGKFHYIVPGLGSLVPGYLLLVTHDHFQNFSCLPSEAHREFRALKLAIFNWTRLVYGSCTVFEHGSFGDGSGGCIDHAHLHFLGADIDLAGHIDQIIGERYSINSPILISEESRNYLYIRQNSNKSAVYYPEKDLERQYLRKICAKLLGKPEFWDYRFHFFEENIHHTIRSFTNNPPNIKIS